MNVFIDTSAFIAYFIKQEMYHRAVVERYTVCRKQHAAFVTSNFVVDELITWFAYHQHAAVVGKLIDRWRSVEVTGEIRVLDVDATTRKKAYEVMVKFSDHAISFTDATTYVLCKDFSIDEVLTLDDDFKKMGLTVAFLNKV